MTCDVMRQVKEKCKLVPGPSVRPSVRPSRSVLKYCTYWYVHFDVVLFMCSHSDLKDEPIKMRFEALLSWPIVD
jgi:hypothetical protein